MDEVKKLLLFAAIIQSALSACIFPTIFKQSSWIDNMKGEVTFTTWELKGWQFTVGTYNISNWEIVDNTQFDSQSTTGEHGYLALRAHDAFEISGTKYYSFVCLKFYKLSDDSYKYYKLHDPDTLAGGERVKTSTTDALTRFEDICDKNYNYDEAQFSILIKKGSDPKSTCPNPILGRFDYTVDNVDGTKSCQGDEDLWDGCKDNKIIEFNYTACAATVANSGEGKLSCIDSTKYNEQNHYQVYVYNLDETVDNVQTFRISCIRVTEDGKEMSIAPSHCRQEQTPYNFPRENGVNIGQKLTTTEISHCRIYPTQKDDEGLSTAAKIGIGVGVGVGVLIIIIIIILCYCCICKRR